MSKAQAYQMAWAVNNIDGTTSEICINDVIVDRQYKDWGGEKRGVSPSSFGEELRKITTPNICVRIHSYGGDVFAAEAIRTAIREARNAGKKITCKIDGVCASAAVGISAACESTAIPASAYFMIHDPALFNFGYYDIIETNKNLALLKKVKQGILHAYAEKTGKTKEELAKLMTAETWYTGDEAVENGFCDEVLFVGGDDGNTAKNIAEMNMTMFKNAPKALLNCTAHPAAVEHKPKNQTKQGGNPVEQPKTAAELKNAFPELTEQVANEAAAAERERIQAIENLAPPGYEELVNQAKADGETTAADVAMKILAAQKQQGATYLAQRDADVAASGVGDVSPAQNDGTNKQTPKTEAEKLTQARADVKRVLGKTDEEDK